MNPDPFEWAAKPWQGGQRIPDASRHQNFDTIAHLSPDLTIRPKSPSLAGIVVRHVDGTRSQPKAVNVTPDGGLTGDRWAVGKRKPIDQISMMNLNVAHRIANGQSVVFSGDNLFADLAMSTHRLPAGTYLKIGEALFEVSAEKHTPCHLFKARFGDAAFRQAAKVERIRGVYLTVRRPGEIRRGDGIQIIGSRHEDAR